MKARFEKRLLSNIAYNAGIGSIEDLPYESDKFDVVFAYCYLDFLEAEESQVDLIISHYWDAAKLGILYNQNRQKPLKHIWVLRFGGRLLTTCLSPPDNLVERVCVFLFTRSSFLSKGVKTIQVESLLKQTHFKKVDILHCSQKGLSVDLAYAEK